MLPKNLAQNLSNISRLVLIKRIGAGLHVVDPYTAEVSSTIIIFMKLILYVCMYVDRW